MPIYKCHLKVWALKLGSVRIEDCGSAMLTPEDGAYARFRVDREYVDKFNPHAGGYYLDSGNGLKSFKPAVEFESGYTLTT
jgi:hypothetical protein